ncbi:cytochrome P450 78A5-like [Aristolochia californica]|uniref:cytochrome P450 78A5-like n=1 Tax=Aristolochia californica TaxID=171875 RepID=UPI0035D807EB
MEKKLHLVANLCFVSLFIGATNHALWLLLFLFFPLYLFIGFLINTWLVAGGFAWRGTPASGCTIPGPIGWPVLGSITVMGPLAHRKLAKISAALGANHLMALSFGTTRVVISSHPDTAKEILSSCAFADRPPKEAARLLMFERAIGFAPSGDYWRQLRRLALTHLFSPRRITNLEVLRQRIAGEMLEKVGKEMNERGIVELRVILQNDSLNSMVGSVFGSFVGAKREELVRMVKEGYDLIGMFNLSDHLPLGFLDVQGLGERCRKLADKVKAVVGEIIKERRRTHADEEPKGDDFLTALLSLPSEEQLSHSDAIAVLWEMIFRGTDTVAIVMEWIMTRMVLHPDVQAKVQQELDSVVGNSRTVRDSDITNLPYLQAVVKEVLRLNPPGPLLSWARLAIRDVQVGKYLIPEGTTAMVNMWAITHDGSIWKDPWEFKPDRFLEEEVSVMGSDLRLAPFGSGRRVCPGKTLGLATVHLWVAHLLHHFNWVVLKSVDLSEHLHLSLEKKKPLQCQAFPRNPCP